MSALLLLLSDDAQGPRSLFAAGEQGFWYDPSDFSTMFQDDAGTTPVTALGQSVGLVLDKSKGLVLGQELVSNGDFATSDGWALQTEVSISGGSLNFNTTATRTATSTGSSCVSGRWYVIEFDMTYTSGIPRFGSGGGSTNISQTTGHKRYIRQATGTNDFYFTCSSGGGVFSIDNLTVRELPGNHAYQSTALSRPTVEARVNLATATEGAAETWFTSNVSNAGTSIAGFSASLQFGDNATARFAYKSVDLRLGTAYTVSLFVQMDDGNAPVVGTNSLSGDFCVVSDGLNHITPATIQGIVGNIYRVSSARTSSIGGSGRNSGIAKYTGQSARTFRIIGIQVEEGTSATTYQRVNTATDYVDVGAPRYLQFDGTDDSMVTPSIDFTGTDKMTLWAGVRKLGGATAVQSIVELSAAGTNPGVFSIFGPRSTAGTYNFLLNGSAAGSLSTSAVFPEPVTNVLSCSFDISKATLTEEIRPRVNAAVPALAALDAGPAGTGNFGNYPLYIGSRGGTTLPLNGRIYQLIGRGAETPLAQIQEIERYVNSKTGAY